ncbi:hypothetical protein ABBQ32_012557 [Trebouxia sp. C0010 RCD-2024]
MPEDASTSQQKPDTSGLIKELWQSGVWKLFPLLLLYITGYGVIVPVTPTLMTDFFASRHSDVYIHCEDYKSHEAPLPCRDAHSDAVNWSSASSFVSNSILSFALAPMIGSWSDKYGRKPFLIAAFSTASLPLLVILLHLQFGLSMLFYFPAQALNGSISSVSICLAYVADKLPPGHRAACFGLILASFSMGILIGPPIGGLLQPIVASYVAISCVLGSLLYVIVVLDESLSERSRLEAQEKHLNGPQSLFTQWKTIKILLRSKLFKRLTLCIMLTGIIQEGLQDLMIQYLQLKLDFGIKDQASLFIIFGVCGLLVQTVLLRVMLSWFSESRVLVIGLCASFTNEVALALAPSKAWAFAAIGVGSIGSVAFPAISSIKANNVRDSEQGTIQGALYGARALAQGTGPIIFAAIFAAFTREESPFPKFAGAPFVFGALLMLVAIGIAWTIDGVSGQRLMLQHQQANSHLDGDASPLGEFDEEAGMTPGASDDNEAHGADEHSSLLSRKGSIQARSRVSGAFSRASSAQPEFARRKSGSPVRSSRTASTGLAGDVL